MTGPLAHRWKPGVDRVPYRLYTDTDVYALEQERIFRGPDWSYVCLAVELPEAGSFVRTEVGDTPVVVTRDASGELHCFVNRCAHRGAAFCMEPRGTTGDFTCPYHQWVYDLAGNCIAVPFRKGVRRQGGMPDDFDMGDHGLTRLRVAERHGVVFATFSDATPPIEDWLGPAMVGWFDRVFDGRDLVLLGHMRQRIPANWKLMFENIKDPYHASLLHVFLVTFGLFRADQPSEVRMDESGKHAVLVSSRGEQRASSATSDIKRLDVDLRLHDERLLDVVREFPGDATVVMQTLWPNLIVQQQANTLATRQLVTRGAGEFDLVWTFFGYADDDAQMVERRLRHANLMGPAGFVSIDDSEVMRLAQIGAQAEPDAEAVLEMGGRGTDGTPHMVTEAAVRAFYAHYRRVMEL